MNRFFNQTYFKQSHFILSDHFYFNDNKSTNNVMPVCVTIHMRHAYIYIDNPFFNKNLFSKTYFQRSCKITYF